MARFLYSIHAFLVRKWDKLFLALFWALGLAFGGLVFRYAGSELVSQMPLAVNCQPSIVGLLISSLLPFLFSAFAVYIGTPALLYGICFFKAFLFIYVSCAVVATFGSAGWLVRWMFLFTDLCSSVVLYHYCWRHISGVRCFSTGGFAVYAAMLFLIAGADYSVVSPLLRRVLS